MAASLRRFAVLALAGAGLTACSGSAPAGPYADDAVVATRVTAVHLDTDAGSVRVDASAGARGVSVHRIVHNQSGRAVGATTRTDGTTLVLGGCEPQCAVDYTLTVPPGVVVDGTTTAGSVSLTGINGVDVTTENGDLTVRDVTTGPIALRTENGHIRATGLGGRGVLAQSTNGAIDLTLTSPQDVKAHSENGTIHLAVPSQPYAVSVRKENGSVDVGVPTSETAAHRLDLAIENGDISVTGT